MNYLDTTIFALVLGGTKLYIKRTYFHRNYNSESLSFLYYMKRFYMFYIKERTEFILYKYICNTTNTMSSNNSNINLQETDVEGASSA